MLNAQEAHEQLKALVAEWPQVEYSEWAAGRKDGWQEEWPELPEGTKVVYISGNGDIFLWLVMPDGSMSGIDSDEHHLVSGEELEAIDRWNSDKLCTMYEFWLDELGGEETMSQYYGNKADGSW
jgi:hypothetical protein